ncbi:hypothetical protein PG996_003278 [Apiospora saccharicola]|uniref:Nephrocystin 3-like N-terminal domain-containing protein n=1 Tax=Apiospora saccharicola TaxID=335842 RepID=A0ABR1W0V6_9PEZI
MSGLEPLVVLGLACNILQIVGTGQKTIAFVSNVYKTGSFDDRIKQHATTLATLSSTIGGIHPPVSISQDEHHLIESANKCQVICQDIIKEIEKLEKGIAKKSKVSTATFAMKVFGKKAVGSWKLDDLEKQLQEAKDLVQLSLVDNTYSRVRTMYADLSILPHDLRSFVKKWGDGKRELNDLISMEGIAIKEHVTAAVNQVQDAQKARLLEHKQAERRQKLLRSLKYNGMNERRNDHHLHHPSTLQTIWKDNLDTDLWQPFRDWLYSEDQVFWVSGKPGSGKTTLMKFLVSQRQTLERLRVWNPNVIVVSHFIWLMGPDPMQRNLKGIFCSVLHQVLTAEATIADYVVGAFGAVVLTENPTDWSLEELKEVWLVMMKKSSIPVCLFLDGLDEVDPKDGTDTLLDIIAANFRPFPCVKLCMASRPEPILRTRLEQAKYPSLALHDVNRPDITRYVESTLKYDGNGKGYLQRLLVDKSNGIFLWTHLVLRNVNRALELSQDFDEARRYIDTMPVGLEDLYESMWERMSRDERQVYSKKIALYFRLLITATKQAAFVTLGFDKLATLSVLQLTLAVAPLRLKILKSSNPTEWSDQASIECEMVKSDLINRCAGFVDVIKFSHDSKDNWFGWNFLDETLLLGERKTSVAFVHRSAIDFLADTPKGQEILGQDCTSPSRLELDVLESQLASLLLEPIPCSPTLPPILLKDIQSPRARRKIGPKIYSFIFIHAIYAKWRLKMKQDTANLLQACEWLSLGPGEIPEDLKPQQSHSDFFCIATRYGHVEYTRLAIQNNRVPESNITGILVELFRHDTILTSPTILNLAHLLLDTGVNIRERYFLQAPHTLLYLNHVGRLVSPFEFLLQSLFRLIGERVKEEAEGKRLATIVPWFYVEVIDLISIMIRAGAETDGNVLIKLVIIDGNFPAVDGWADDLTHGCDDLPGGRVWVDVPTKEIIRLIANCLLLDSRLRSSDKASDVRNSCKSLSMLFQGAQHFLHPEVVGIGEGETSNHPETDLAFEGKQLARLANDIFHLASFEESTRFEHEAVDIFRERERSDYGDNNRRAAWIESGHGMGSFWKELAAV